MIVVGEPIANAKDFQGWSFLVRVKAQTHVVMLLAKWT